MRKTIVLAIVMGMFLSLASFTIRPKTDPVVKASAVMIPVGKEGKAISLLDLSRISRTDLEKLTGKRMGLAERLAFKGAQKKLRHSIDENDNIQSRKLKKHLAGKAAREYDGTSGFHLGGFALGFLLGLIGVLIAYLINDGKKTNRVKWSWIGLAIWVGIVLIAFVL